MLCPHVTLFNALVSETASVAVIVVPDEGVSPITVSIQACGSVAGPSTVAPKFATSPGWQYEFSACDGAPPPVVPATAGDTPAPFQPQCPGETNCPHAAEAARKT